MDTSYLAQQVNTIIGQLHGLFDEIGVPNHERDTRESEVSQSPSPRSKNDADTTVCLAQLFSALSEALHNQVRIVTAEKKEMVDEAQKMITTIRQMEASLDDNRPRREYQSEEDELKVTFPLTRCLQVLKEKHIQIGRLHRERYEQVKSMPQHHASYTASANTPSQSLSKRWSPTPPILNRHS